MKYLEGTKIEDLTGMTFGDLTVIKFAGRAKDNKPLWECICSCGKSHITKAKYLKNGDCKSCGHRFEEAKRSIGEKRRTHGATTSDTDYLTKRLYKTWTAIKCRTTNENQKTYKEYGARDIKMCEEWLNDFEAFKTWALNNGFDPNLTIDRIDVNKGYSPDNCRWANEYIQRNNKQNTIWVEINGRKKSLKHWCDLFGLKYGRVYDWYYRKGISAKESLFKFLNKEGKSIEDFDLDKVITYDKSSSINFK